MNHSQNKCDEGKGIKTWVRNQEQNTNKNGVGGKWKGGDDREELQMVRKKESESKGRQRNRKMDSSATLDSSIDKRERHLERFTAAQLCNQTGELGHTYLLETNEGAGSRHKTNKQTAQS